MKPNKIGISHLNPLIMKPNKVGISHLNLLIMKPNKVGRGRALNLHLNDLFHGDFPDHLLLDLEAVAGFGGLGGLGFRVSGFRGFGV